MFNEGNQIHNFILCVYENFYDSILLRFRLFDKLRFRFHMAISYGSYSSGSTTLVKSHFYWIWIRRKFDQLPVPGYLFSEEM
jgi:hypothetical protein